MERKERQFLFLGVCAPRWRLHFPTSKNDTHTTHTYAGADPVHREFITGRGDTPPLPPDARACVGGFPLGAAACFFCNFITCPVVWTCQGSFLRSVGSGVFSFCSVGWIGTADHVLKADPTSTSPGAQFLYLVIQLVTLVVSIKTAFIALSPLVSARVLLSLLALGPGTLWGWPDHTQPGIGSACSPCSVFSLDIFCNFGEVGWT